MASGPSDQLFRVADILNVLADHFEVSGEICERHPKAAREMRALAAWMASDTEEDYVSPSGSRVRWILNRLRMRLGMYVR